MRLRKWYGLVLILVLTALIGRTGPAAAASESVWPDPIGTPRTATPTAVKPASMDRQISVDLSAQRLSAYQGRTAVFSFPVSTGRNGNTAVGKFRILDKHLGPTNARWGYTMPYWMGVYWAGRGLENGFHALPVTPDGRELWGDLIGTPASDGCIVLRAADMRRLFEWAQVGIPVEIVE